MIPAISWLDFQVELFQPKRENQGRNRDGDRVEKKKQHETVEVNIDRHSENGHTKQKHIQRRVDSAQP